MVLMIAARLCHKKFAKWGILSKMYTIYTCISRLSETGRDVGTSGLLGQTF